MVVDAYNEIQDSSENQPRQLSVKQKMRVTEEHTQCESIHTVFRNRQTSTTYGLGMYTNVFKNYIENQWNNQLNFSIVVSSGRREEILLERNMQRASKYCIQFLFLFCFLSWVVCMQVLVLLFFFK